MTREEFWRLRDGRSGLYLGQRELNPRGVTLLWGNAAASSPGGQILLLATLNQISRFARSVSLIGPDATLVVPGLVAAPPSLRETLSCTARAIDPFMLISNEAMDNCIRIGFGNDAPLDADIYVGGRDWDAIISTDRRDVPPMTVGGGVAFAACIAAAHAFKASLAVDAEMFIGIISTWSMLKQHVDAPALPAETDLGKVLIAGAGAVASAFAYWARLLRIRAKWDVVDRDSVDVTNTNRGLLFTAVDAGIGIGRPLKKADVLASWLENATPHDQWLHEYVAKQGARPWDLYLPLANDLDARAVMQRLYPPLMLHATTGEHWQSFRHRHRAIIDGCIVCRFPGDIPVTSCSASALKIEGDTRRDAALPFMSAAAGLLLALDCIKLGLGCLAGESFLLLDWQHGLAVRSGEWPCSAECKQWDPKSVHSRLNGATKWFEAV